jgi:hypothetical protein
MKGSNNNHLRQRHTQEGQTENPDQSRPVKLVFQDSQTNSHRTARLANRTCRPGNKILYPYKATEHAYHGSNEYADQ